MDKELEADIRSFLDAAEKTFGGDGVGNRFFGSRLWEWAATRQIKRKNANSAENSAETA